MEHFCLCSGYCLWLNWLVCEQPEQEAPCRGLGRAVKNGSTSFQAILCKTFLSQDFLHRPFSLPPARGLSDGISSGNSCLNP